MKTVTLITGGVRSGKSRYALELAQARHREEKAFLATPDPLHDELEERVAFEQNKPERDFPLADQPVFLAREIMKAQNETDLVLIDSLTVWLNNLLYHFTGQPKMIEREIQAFLGVVGEKRTDMIFVTNEVGFGITPENLAARKFAEQLGDLNQKVARLSDEVVLMVSGIPQVIKRSTVDAGFDDLEHFPNNIF